MIFAPTSPAPLKFDVALNSSGYIKYGTETSAGEKTFSFNRIDFAKILTNSSTSVDSTLELMSGFFGAVLGMTYKTSTIRYTPTYVIEEDD